MMPEIITICGLVLSSTIFYLYARGVNKEKLTLDGFMVANNSLNESQYSSTFAASSFSLGMTVVFLLGSTKSYGLWIIVSPITYVLGHIFFTWVIKKSFLDVKGCKTISDICYMIYPNKNVARIITGLTLGSYVMLLFLELYIVTVFLEIFIGESFARKGIVFLGTGILALLYVRLGGYKAIVKTDKWQLSMMLLAVAGIFLFGVYAPIKNSRSVSELISASVDYQVDLTSLITMMLWLTAINAVYPFAQLTNIQRLTATKCKNTSFIGVLRGSWKLLALFLFTTVGFLLMHIKGYEINNINDFLMLVRQGNGFETYVLFPVLVTGFASMVFSSTDICIIAISYALSDRNTFEKSFTKMDEKTLRRVLTICISILLTILTIIYWLQFTVLQEWLMPVIFTTCGQLAILTPIPIYAIIKLRKQKTFKPIQTSRKKTLLIFNSILTAWVLLFVGAFMSKTTGKEYWSLFSM
ncbi:MAG: hypothetical protein HRT87_09790, partial [Legionellales bacterium]|nr:hypothetical protein [Legionellales bacterium]